MVTFDLSVGLDQSKMTSHSEIHSYYKMIDNPKAI